MRAEETRKLRDGGGSALNTFLLSLVIAGVAVGCTRSGEGDDAAPEVEPILASVTASAETVPVEAPGDVADDPAIWIHPTDPSASLIIGTAKDEGLYVYGLDGGIVQVLREGRMNNVDVRYRFPLSSGEIDLVAASEQNNDLIALYTVDPATGSLSTVSDGPQPAGFAGIAGLCMYHSRESGRFYVFGTGGEGSVRQWELVERNGRVAINPVRDLQVETEAEGCVADDETGALYIAEEDRGLWRFGAEPSAGPEHRLVGEIAAIPGLQDDLEGLSIYYGEAGAGYVIVSSQGNNTYAVFDRTGDNAYVTSFEIADGGAIDGTSDTDGIHVISTSLGAGFPEGLMVAQDGENLLPAANQNFKLVSWTSIAAPLGLRTYTGWNPRDW